MFNTTKKENIYYRRNGITLVELLIVVSIIAVVSLAIIPSYVDYSAKKDFDNKVEIMTAEVMNIRNKSLAGAVLSSSGTLVNWGISPSCGTANYSVGYQVVGSSTFVVDTTLQLPTGVTFVVDGGGQCDVIAFERLTGTPILSDTEQQRQISLRYRTTTRVITVSRLGRISYN